MASKPKSTARKKNTRSTGGKNTSGKRGNRKKGGSQEVSFGSEVVLLIILAVCIILFLSNLGVGGFVGTKVSGFCFGVLGMAAYIFPICFFVGAAFMVSNRDNGIAIVKITAGAVFVSFLCLFMELVAGDSETYQLQKSFQYAAEHKSGGGALGGLLAMFFCPAIGKAGTYVVDIIALIISLVLLTEHSFLGGVKKSSRKVYDTAREDAARRREVKELRREERNQRRMDRKVEGVALDTRIQPVSPERSDNISELKLPIETEAFSKELKEKLFANKKEEVPPKTMKHVVGWEKKEKMSAVPVVDIPVKTTKSQPQSILSEPVVVEKVHKMPRRSGLASEKKQGELLKEEREWPLETGETEVLLAREEPVVITPEPFGAAEKEAADSLQNDILHDFDISDEVFAGLESAIISRAAEEQADGHVSEQEFELEDVLNSLMEADTEKESAARAEESSLSREREENFGAEAKADSVSREEMGTKKETDSVRKEEMGTQREADFGNSQRRISKPEHIFPPLSLLKKGEQAQGDSRKYLQETALKLQQTLKNFGVNVTITDVSCGPSVTRYEMQPEMGVKVSKIVNLADDIKLNLAATDIRIEAPIPGKAAVGIEVPNKENVMVRFRDMVESEEFQRHKSNICFTAGKDIGGQAVVADIAKMPHLLIAGATGSGKSVCINTIIMSILYKADPDDVKLILIDPKVVELSVYNGIPHLLIPVVTDPKKAAGALHWAVAEMMDRYQKFADCQVRDLRGYNQKIAQMDEPEGYAKPEKLSQIVVVVDELADLMMVAPGDVEDAICRLAQLARAAGIHLIIATQRPSVDVITGLIKANMPSRIAFSVSSGVDSRTILDMNGAEKLLGNGDMLFYPQGYQKPLRVQGPFVSDSEVESVVGFLKKQSTVVYNSEIEEKVNTVSIGASSGGGSGAGERDAYFADAGRFVIEKEKGSIGMLQRMFKIGFNRAARIMDQLEESGVVGPEEGTKPRKVQMTLEEFETYIEEHL